jgi:hypothetical protein
MDTLQIAESVKERLLHAEGANLEEKVARLVLSDLQSRLKACMERLYGFEKKYGLKFQQFRDLWEKDDLPEKFSYETEADYMEWESLSHEQDTLLSEIRKLRVEI